MFLKKSGKECVFVSVCRQCRLEPSYVACLINSDKQAGNVCRLLQLIIQPKEEVIVSR